jgi:hypothetical protein
MQMSRVRSVLKWGRIRHAFAVMVAVGLFVVPTVTALAYYSSTGTGNVTGVSATTTTTSTVNLDQAAPPTTLAPGGSTTLGLAAKCLTGCPAFVSTVNLSTWSSDKTGCTPAAMPGSFTMPTLVVNQSIPTTATGIGNATITWNNLVAIDQSPCQGGHFTFVVVTP